MYWGPKELNDDNFYNVSGPLDAIEFGGSHDILAVPKEYLNSDEDEDIDEAARRVVKNMLPVELSRPYIRFDVRPANLDVCEFIAYSCSYCKGGYADGCIFHRYADIDLHNNC